MSKLEDLYRTVRSIVDNDGVKKQIIKILADDSRILLTPQRNQLFYKSQDAEGKPLGFYKIYDSNEVQDSFSEKTLNEQGQPFTMVYSGRFRRGLFQIVTPTAIWISSSAPHLDDMVDNENDIFLSTNFFGITDRNMKNIVIPRILKKLKPWMVDTMLKMKIVT